jgi:hypothetical protein
MEVVKDITGGAKTITFFAGGPASVGVVGGRGAESKGYSKATRRTVLAGTSTGTSAMTPLKRAGSLRNVLIAIS